MNFLISRQAKEHEDPLHHVVNSVQTHFTHFVQTFSSNPCPLWASITDQFHNLSNNMGRKRTSVNVNVVDDDQCKKNLSEIKQRLNAIPVYRASYSSRGRAPAPLMSDDRKRSAVFYFFSKQDAEVFLKEKADMDLGLQLIKVPLAEIIEVEGLEYAARSMSVRLVPDMFEVRNALEERNDDSFSGVPVFQSDALRMMVAGYPSWCSPFFKRKNICRPVFFRKDDIEKALDDIKRFNHREIRVTALEDIMREMKDYSRWKDVVFIPPGDSRLHSSVSHTFSKWEKILRMAAQIYLTFF